MTERKLDTDALLLQVLAGIRELHARTAEIEKRLDKLEASYSLEVEWHNRLLKVAQSEKEMVRRYFASINVKLHHIRKVSEK